VTQVCLDYHTCPTSHKKAEKHKKQLQNEKKQKVKNNSLKSQTLKQELQGVKHD